MSRKRWVYKNGVAIEVGQDFVNARDAVPHDSVLWNDRAYQDMGDRRFSSRAQHRAYMAANGLTTMDDFTETWSKAAKARAEFMTSGRDKSRREVIERALYNQLNRK